jgi:hypothetical protein
VIREQQDEVSGRKLRVAALVLVAGVAVGAMVAVLVKSQISRHRRDLFSPSVLDRLAALGYIAREPASVEGITLLRDFISWERRGLLRARARAILDRMETEAIRGLKLAGEKAG